MPLNLPAMNAAIVCDGKELDTYDVKQNGTSSLTAFVASEAGKRFKIKVSNNLTDFTLAIILLIDGWPVEIGCLPAGMSDAFSGVYKSERSIVPFKFQLVDPGLQDKPVGPGMGSIELKAFRCHKQDSVELLEQVSDEDHHWRRFSKLRKKAGWHHIAVTGDEVAVGKRPPPVRVHYVDPWTGPSYASIKIFYRPREVLSAQGVIIPLKEMESLRLESPIENKHVGEGGSPGPSGSGSGPKIVVKSEKEELLKITIIMMAQRIKAYQKDTSQVVVGNHYNFLQAAHSEDPLLDDESGIRHVYDSHIKGYAGRFTDTVLESIRQQPEVDYVERDQIVRTQDEIVKTQDKQTGAPWGLARISHRPKLSFGTFNKYQFDSHGGEGVNVYVIDTGIHINHAEFGDRAFWGKTIPQNNVDEDGNGHGTHCAGTIASGKYGVAKAANVIAVKVLGSNGSGSMSDVVAGVVFAAEDAIEKAKDAAAEVKATGKTKHKGSVANMSLGGGKSNVLDQAVNGAVETGLHFAVAAGNDNRDACSYSPAAAEKAVTVGASTLADERAYFSNFGPCVDVFAPGLNILSTWIGSKHAVNTISGTSMASPHTAGLLAYLLSIPINHSIYSIMLRWASGFLPSPRLVHAITAPVYKPISPAVLKKALISLSTPNVLTEIPADTVNKLIFNNYTAT
ncbi:Peptidase S8/S53 domain containing protein [Lactarius tabidus]